MSFLHQNFVDTKNLNSIFTNIKAYKKFQHKTDSNEKL